MYNMIYTCASRYDAFTRSVDFPAALIPEKAMPGREGRSWLICFWKRRFPRRRRDPACPGTPGSGARGSGGEGPGTHQGVLQRSQWGREGLWAGLLSPGVCTERGAGLPTGYTEQGRSATVGPAVAKLAAPGGRGDGGAAMGSSSPSSPSSPQRSLRGRAQACLARVPTLLRTPHTQAATHLRLHRWEAQMG